MKNIILAVLVVLSMGCAFSMSGGRSTATPEDCSGYDNAYMGWTATAAVSGGLAGVGGVVTPIVDGNDDAIMAVGISTAVLGAVSTAAGLIASMYAQRYAERCGGEVVEIPIPDPVPVEPVVELPPEPAPVVEPAPEPAPEPTPPEPEVVPVLEPTPAVVVP